MLGMVNSYVSQRLAGIQGILNGVHRASASLSSNSKGTERQAFVENFLGQVLPTIYRFGTGDATDSFGARSGQLDVVVEYPVAPSLPSVGGGQNSTRLYLAESVAAVIEVKSDAAAQWQEAVQTAKKLAALRRSFGSLVTMGRGPAVNIPLFVVGYTGWAQEETLQSKLKESPEVAGILVIDSGLFVGGGLSARGPLALWALIVSLHQIANALMAAAPNLIAYAR